MIKTKASIILFSLRLLLYFSVITLIFIHPGITVKFDSIGIALWFFIIPLIAAIVFFVPQLNAIWIKVAALEPFFLAWVCLKLLSLSRSGEDIAEQSLTLTQFILVWTVVVFLLHSVVIYLCLFPKSRIRVWKEGLVFFLGSLAVLSLVIIVLPPDFVRNTVIENLVSERMPEIIKPSDSDRGLPQRGNGRRTLPGDENGRGELRGLSEHDWQGRGGGSGESRQYMIKIVISDREPVYMGNVFRGQLDPVKGFLVNHDEHLNDLASQRFFVTWFDNDRERDSGRRRQEVFSLSTLRHKYLPYRPVVIDPAILSENTGPLRYIHQVVSNIHDGDPLYLVNTPTRLFTNRERVSLAQYLDVTLDDDDRKVFETYLNNALDEWKNNREEIIDSDRYLTDIFSGRQNDLTEYNMYLENIIAILVSFSKFQYNLNPDDSSIEALADFLVNVKEGDCVEFSNSLALLGRLAGIPSRVVTGYLASEGLQTQAHIRGLAALRSRIPYLQQFPFNNLFMVTNIHSHSWTQFYIPDYGWLDFEATSFSIAPQGMGDFNNWDVVIPILDQNRTFSNVRKFPWRAAGRTAITLVVLALVCAYALRYGRELTLSLGVKRGGREGARSLYLLLLARLAADGKPIKPASKTAHEYSELFPYDAEEPLFKQFADIYSELRWRENTPEEANERFKALVHEYRSALGAIYSRGPHHVIKRLLSLRGLAYL